MPVLFSRACEYALRALFEMARHPEQDSWKVQELAQRTDTPAPQRISLIEIVDLIDGPDVSKNCALGLAHCSDDTPCPFHGHWKSIRASISNTLRHETLVQNVSQKIFVKMLYEAEKFKNLVLLKFEKNVCVFLQP